MAEVKGLKAGATGVEQLINTDTFPVAHIPDITSAKVTDFTEAAQDAVGAMADANSLTYTDGTPLLEVKVQMSITKDASGLKLSGDAASPGNNKLYGTNGSGTKGWFDQPTGAGETYVAGENLTAGDLVYINSSGEMMKADANTSTKRAMGFVLDTITAAASGTFYRGPGKNTALAGLTAGAFYYLSNTATGAAATYGTLTYATNDIQQFVGIAESTTALAFEPGTTILIA